MSCRDVPRAVLRSFFRRGKSMDGPEYERMIFDAARFLGCCATRPSRGHVHEATLGSLLQDTPSKTRMIGRRVFLITLAGWRRVVGSDLLLARSQLQCFAWLDALRLLLVGRLRSKRVESVLRWLGSNTATEILINNVADATRLPLHCSWRTLFRRRRKDVSYHHPCAMSPS